MKPSTLAACLVILVGGGDASPQPAYTVSSQPPRLPPGVRPWTLSDQTNTPGRFIVWTNLGEIHYACVVDKVGIQFVHVPDMNYAITIQGAIDSGYPLRR